MIIRFFFAYSSGAHHALAIEHPSSEQVHIVTSIPMQSVVLPCRAVLPHQEPERVRISKTIIGMSSINHLFLFKVIWYKLINTGQSSTLSVSNQLITKDSRFSVAYYSIDHGFSPAKWDLHISNVRLSDAAHYQCHVTNKDNRKSTRSNVKLVIEGKWKNTPMYMWICTYRHLV